MNTAVTSCRREKHVWHRTGFRSEVEDDLLVTEAPLQIVLQYGDWEARQELTLAITMRTPGQDAALGLGFLLTEGLIQHPSEVQRIWHCPQVKPEEQGNVLKIALLPQVSVLPATLQRHFYMTSSCGVCGKTSIEAVQMAQCRPLRRGQVFTPAQIAQFSDQLRAEQTVFRYTGGVHAAGLFDEDGALRMMYEDVGRHNALDKLIGGMAAEGLLDVQMGSYAVFVSGRIGFELVQKCAVAGLACLAAVGAPSSLAVSLAQSVGMQLFGFVRGQTLNQYA